MTRDARDRPAKWRTIEADLRAQISALPPGQPVPAITVTAARHQVNRQTAAKAYRLIAGEGRLVFHPGLGYHTTQTAPAPDRKTQTG
jgi:DNA-binding transcriptional regulator YhcF (GntR family)